MVTSGLAKSQRGAAAIEAALVFTLFFALFYAIISYSMPMIMMQAFNHAAASAARSAVAVDPAAYPDTDSYIQTGVIPRVRNVAGNALNWLPTTANDAVLGDNNANIQVAFDHASGVLTVTIVYPQYRNAPLMPTLTLPGIGDVPRLPDDLRGMASVSL
jgi:Flp pilus assembly protein TadG